MTKSRFIKMLWLYVALTIASIAASLLSNHSENLSLAYAGEPLPWLLDGSWFAVSLLIVFVGAWLIGLIGLFRFKQWGRALSFYSTLAGLIIVAFLGSTLSSGLESALYEASMMLWGAIIAVAYFSPLSERFDRDDESSPVAT